MVYEDDIVSRVCLGTDQALDLLNAAGHGWDWLICAAEFNVWCETAVALFLQCGDYFGPAFWSVPGAVDEDQCRHCDGYVRRVSNWLVLVVIVNQLKTQLRGGEREGGEAIIIWGEVMELVY